MELDFDNLRIQMAETYNRLTATLNNNFDRYGNGTIVVPTSYIAKDIESLRMMIHTLGCCYDEKAGINSVHEQIGNLQTLRL